MKKTFTLFRVLLTLVLLCGVSSAWGKEWKHIFLSPEKISGNAITVNGATWNVSTTPGQGSPEISAENSNSLYGLKFGRSSSVYYGSVTFSTSYFTDKKVTKVVCKILNNGKKTGTLTATQGAKTINTTSKEFGQSWTELTLDGELDGGNIGNGGDLSITYQVQQAFYVSSIVVTYENKTSETYTVTFDAGANGECSTSSLTEASAGAGVTLPSCTANEWYVFKGWADENGKIVGQAGETYKPASNCTLYAVYNAVYTLTITQPTNGGTLTVSDGANALSTGDKVEVGTNLTCEVADIPEGQRFSRFYVKWGDGENDKKYKATNPATFDEIPTDISTLEVYVTYMPLEKYTINYMVNGVNTDAQENVYEGTALVFPTVTELGGKVFVGWNESEIEEETDVKPTLVETAGLKASKNVTYYAVFATETKGTEPEELLEQTLQYDTWTYSGTTTDKTTYRLFGNDAYVESDDLDLSKISKVVVYGGTFGGSDYKDLTIGDGTNMWKSVTVSGSSQTGKNTYTEGAALSGTGKLYIISKSGNGSSNGVRISKIEIYIMDMPTVYSAYSTTVLPQTQDVTISSAGYATAYIPFNATVSNEEDDVKAYFVTVEGTTAKLNEIEGTIPANTGMVLKGTGKVTFTESVATPADVTGNLLVGTTNENGEDFEDSEYTYYILSNGTNGVGFYWDGKNYDELEGLGAHCAQYKAILAVPESAGIQSFFTFDEATAINVIDNAKVSGVRYNLNGQAVGADYKGIVIVNGKKMFNK